MTRTYSQMHHTGKYSEHSSIIWPVWPNGSVFVYELSGSGFESSCSHLNFRFHACFDQGVPWHSGNYRVWIHSETCMWHAKNIQLNVGWFVRHKSRVAFLHALNSTICSNLSLLENTKKEFIWVLMTYNIITN